LHQTESPGSSGRFAFGDRIAVLMESPVVARDVHVLRCGRFALDLSRPRVMGIVNLTPDSFSDGGSHRHLDDAVAHAERLIEEGSDLIDVGAESTRPGATTITVEEEWLRLQPFLDAMRDARVPISVDTRKPDVMRRALDAGASMINDVEGFATVESRRAVSKSDCGLCVMHMQGQPETMQIAPHYVDVVNDVRNFLAARCEILLSEGIADDRLIVDPGFGFGKTHDHNLALLRRLDTITTLRWPVLVGLSRKGMIGTLTGRPVGERTAGSVAAALIAVERGAKIVRAHDVAATADAIRVWSAARP
jgi:dihydropteroate synthase